MWGCQRCAYLGCHQSAGDIKGWCRRPPWSAANVMWVVKQRQKWWVRKYRRLWYIFYRRIRNSNQCFRTRFNLVLSPIFLVCVYNSPLCAVYFLVPFLILSLSRIPTHCEAVTLTHERHISCESETITQEEIVKIRVMYVNLLSICLFVVYLYLCLSVLIKFPCCQQE